MALITYTDKSVGPGDTGKWKAADANEVKSVVNSNQADLEELSDIVATAQLSDPTLTTFIERVATDSGTTEGIQETFDNTEEIKRLGFFGEFPFWLTPSGFKATKLYAIKPIDGDGDLTITRASLANRINSTGSLESVANNVPRVDWFDDIPTILSEPSMVNLIVGPNAPATQGITVTAQRYSLSFYGTGTITLSGTYSGTLVGTGDNDRVKLEAFIPTAGTLTLTISGTVTNAQLEARDHITSYFAGTRQADSMSVSAINTNGFSGSEGSMYLHIRDNISRRRDNINLVVGVRDSVTGDFLGLGRAGAGTRLFVMKKVGGVTTTGYTTTTDEFKIAFRWSGTTFDVYVNGIKVASDQSRADVSYNIFEIQGANGIVRIEEAGLSPEFLIPQTLKELTVMDDTTLLREVYPEDFGAEGDGVTDDAEALQAWADALSSVDYIGRGSAGIYMTSETITFTGHPNIDFDGVIRRTASSTIDEIVRFDFGSSWFVSVKINVDGNVSNANDCIGIVVDEGLNVKTDLNLSAWHCSTGIRLTGNFEQSRIFTYVNDNDIGVEVYNDGSSNTPDELWIWVSGAANRTAFKATGDQKCSGVVFFNHEVGGEDYAVIIENGVWSLQGELRGADGGVLVKNTLSPTSPLIVDFNSLFLYGERDTNALYALLVDAGSSCLITGDITINRHEKGVWIKECAQGSSLRINRRSSTAANDVGLKLGDTGKTVSGFVLLPGSVLAGVPALNLENCVSSTFNIDNVLSGSLVIASGSSANRILLPSFEHTTTITNNRTQKDNLVIFTGVLTTTQRNNIPSPIKGYRCEGVDDGNVIKAMNYNDTTDVWE